MDRSKIVQTIKAGLLIIILFIAAVVMCSGCATQQCQWSTKYTPTAKRDVHMQSVWISGQKCHAPHNKNHYKKSEKERAKQMKKFCR